jgi:hypothetical protein
MRVDKSMLSDLIDERLPRDTVRAIQSSFKDPARFDTYGDSSSFGGESGVGRPLVLT